MPIIQKFDLLNGIPEHLPVECFNNLATGANYKIERIISKGHQSPPDFWYDQAWDEWVVLLKGQAVISFQEPPRDLDLSVGQGLLIPAGCRHRVAWTDPETETIWLAVHIFNLRMTSHHLNGRMPVNEQPMDKTTYRQILDEAIEREIEANLFYQQAAHKVQNAYLKKMFLDFAEEEHNHRRILEGFRSDERRALHFAQVTDYHLADTITDPPLSLAMKPADAIALAIKKEDAAMKHYSQLAQACSDEAEKRIFMELAVMEQGHKTKMEKAFVDIGFPEVW